MKKKILIGCLMVVIISAFVVVNIAGSSGSIPVFNSSAVNVKVKALEKGSITSIITASGVIEETAKQEVFFDTPVKILKVLVNKNQKVIKGQKLLELDMDSLNSELAQLKISKATQELTLQRTISQDTQKNVASLEAALNIAVNNRDGAVRNLEDAARNLTTSEALYSAGALSQSELDRARKSVSDAEAALKNAGLNVETAQHNLEEAKKSNDQLAYSKSMDVETQKKNLEAASLRISDLERKIAKLLEASLSPVDGIITERNVENGGFTNTAQPAFRIVNPDSLHIKADIKEYDIKNIKLSQKVIINGDAISKDKAITGKIAAISPVAKKSRTTSGDETMIEVTISIDNTDSQLKPGLSTTCDIVTGEKSNVVLASFEMFRDDKDGNKLVYVFDSKSGVISERRVKLGASSDLDVEVVEGLKEGEEVVLNPMPSYKDGMRARRSE